MSEDNLQQQDIKDFKKPFRVYWNVPTMQCASKKIPFQNLYEKFGIIQNANDSFIGNKIVIIYNENDFPAIIYNKTRGKNILRNGGVPQKGNLENHLMAFVNNLNDKIPDPYFDGVAIIDFESWRPVFRQNFGNSVPHKHLSIKIEKDLHNWWPQIWIKREAALRFEAASRRFMQTTLSIAKEKRPNALWGYYGFPHCFNMRDRDMTEKCERNIGEENDSIYWLWAESTALFPSLYSSVSLSSSQLSSLIKGRVKEASRVRGRNTPIFPYFWYRYRDAGFITEKDLEVALTTLYESNASGFIIWGSSNDVNTVDKCNKLLNYVETVLGPKISKYTKQRKRTHSDNLENKEIYTKETSSDYDGFYYSGSTQSSNTDNMFSSKTSFNFEESSQTLNNDDRSATEKAVIYNDNTDDSQTLNNFDLTLSAIESSTMYNEYVNTNQSIESLKNVDILNNDDIILSSEFSTFDYEHTDHSTTTVNNDDIIFSSEPSTFDFEHRDQSTTILNNNDAISSSEYSTFDYEHRDHSTTTLNNDDIISSSEPSTFDFEHRDHNSTILNNDDVISASESSTFDYEHKDHSTTTLNNDDVISASESSTFDYEHKDQSIITSNSSDMFSIDNSTLYSKYTYTDQSNKEISSKGISTIYDDSVSENPSTEKLNKVKSLKDNSPTSDEIGNTAKSTDILIDDEIITENNEFDLTGDYFFNNNMLRNSTEDQSDYFIKVDISTNIKTFKQSEYTDNTNVDDDYLIMVRNVKNKPNLKENISDSKLETVYQTTQSVNNHESMIESDKFSETTNDLDLVVKYVDKTIEIEKDEDSITTKVEFFPNITLLNSSDDSSDYLIIADNYTNIQTYNQLEQTNIDNADNDYLIIVTDFNIKQNEKDSILDNNLDLDPHSTIQTETDFVTDMKFDDFGVTVENLDPVVGYISKTIDNTEFQDSIPTEDDSLINIELLKSDEDSSDYLINVDSYTNKETEKQYEYTESPIADNDYIIVPKSLDI